MRAAALDWRWYAWSELDPDTLHDFLKLRSDVFVVEQDCVFSEMDGVDARCEHLVGRDAAQHLVAYLRLVPPGVKNEHPSLGRVVVARESRGAGHARAAMQQGLQRCAERYPGRAVFLSGQQHLQDFYASLGFAPSGGVYIEDGIPHVNMLRVG